MCRKLHVKNNTKYSIRGNSVAIKQFHAFPLSMSRKNKVKINDNDATQNFKTCKSYKQYGIVFMQTVNQVRSDFLLLPHIGMYMNFYIVSELKKKCKLCKKNHENYIYYWTKNSSKFLDISISTFDFFKRLKLGSFHMSKYQNSMCPLGIIIFSFQTLQPTYIVWDKDLCLVIQHDFVIISKKDCYLVHIPTRPAPAPRVHALNFASFYLTRTQYFTYMYVHLAVVIEFPNYYNPPLTFVLPSLILYYTILAIFRKGNFQFLPRAR